MGEVINFANKKILLTQVESDILQDVLEDSLKERKEYLDVLKNDTSLGGKEKFMITEEIEYEIEVLNKILEKLK